MAREGTLTLTKKLRQTLKKPLGVLRASIRDVSAGNIACVGDVVSEDAVLAGLEPKIIVYDGRTKRVETGIPEAAAGYDAREIRVENPAGLLTREAMEAVKDAFQHEGKTKIHVTGEEDLLTLPAVKYAPEGWSIVYGQPDEGIVEVKVNEKTKNKIEKILEEMKNGS
ncbi:MAG: DUF359 domain-containing protein [Candidatus Altiarchaeota archaeon]